MSSSQKLLVVVSLTFLTQTSAGTGLGCVQDIPGLMNIINDYTKTKVVLKNFPIIDWMQRDEIEPIDVNGTCVVEFNENSKARVNASNPFQILYEDVKLCDKQRGLPVKIHVAKMHYHNRECLAIVIKTTQRGPLELHEAMPEYDPVREEFTTAATFREVVIPLFTQPLTWAKWNKSISSLYPSGHFMKQMANDCEQVFDFMEGGWTKCTGKVKLRYADVERMDLFTTEDLDWLLAKELEKKQSGNYWWKSYHEDMITMPACTAISRDIRSDNIEEYKDTQYRYPEHYYKTFDKKLSKYSVREWIRHYINDGIRQLKKIKYNKYNIFRSRRKKRKQNQKLQADIEEIQKKVKTMMDPNVEKKSSLAHWMLQLAKVKILLQLYTGKKPEKKKNYTWQTDPSMLPKPKGRRQKENVSKKGKPTKPNFVGSVPASFLDKRPITFNFAETWPRNSKNEQVEGKKVFGGYESKKVDSNEDDKIDHEEGTGNGGHMI